MPGSISSSPGSVDLCSGRSSSAPGFNFGLWTADSSTSLLFSDIMGWDYHQEIVPIHQFSFFKKGLFYGQATLSSPTENTETFSLFLERKHPSCRNRTFGHSLKGLSRYLNGLPKRVLDYGWIVPNLTTFLGSTLVRRLYQKKLSLDSYQLVVV